MDALVGEFHRDAQPGVFHEPALDLPQGVHVAGKGLDQVPALLIGPTDSVELLVDIGDPVRPDLVFPSIGRQGVLEDTAVPVQGGQLAGFFLQGHLADQVVQAVGQGSLRILVDIHPSVLVEINPVFVIDFPLGDELKDQQQAGKKFHIRICQELSSQRYGYFFDEPMPRRLRQPFGLQGLTPRMRRGKIWCQTPFLNPTPDTANAPGLRFRVRSTGKRRNRTMPAGLYILESSSGTRQSSPRQRVCTTRGHCEHDPMYKPLQISPISLLFPGVCTTRCARKTDSLYKPNRVRFGDKAECISVARQGAFR